MAVRPRSHTGVLRRVSRDGVVSAHEHGGQQQGGDRGRGRGRGATASSEGQLPDARSHSAAPCSGNGFQTNRLGARVYIQHAALTMKVGRTYVLSVSTDHE